MIFRLGSAAALHRADVVDVCQTKKRLKIKETTGNGSQRGVEHEIKNKKKHDER